MDCTIAKICSCHRYTRHSMIFLTRSAQLQSISIHWCLWYQPVSDSFHLLLCLPCLCVLRSMFLQVILDLQSLLGPELSKLTKQWGCSVSHWTTFLQPFFVGDIKRTNAVIMQSASSIDFACQNSWEGHKWRSCAPGRLQAL